MAPENMQHEIQQVVCHTDKCLASGNGSPFSLCCLAVCPLGFTRAEGVVDLYLVVTVVRWEQDRRRGTDTYTHSGEES